MIRTKQSFVESGGGRAEGQKPKRIRADGGRETGRDRVRCGIRARAGRGTRMRDVKFFDDFLAPF